MEATHGTFRHWAMGLRTRNVAGGIFLTAFQLIQEIWVNSSRGPIRQLAIILTEIVTAIATIVVAPIAWIRHQNNIRQNNAEVEALTTKSITEAIEGLSADKTVKITIDNQVVERTEPNLETRIGAILALERIAQRNLDAHIRIMGMINCE